MLDQFWLWSMQAGLKNSYDSIKAFSETDFTVMLMRDMEGNGGGPCV
jgi:non-heme chloroperoxidase